MSDSLFVTLSGNLTLGELFPHSAELQRLATLMDDMPYIMEIVIASYQTPQVMGSLLGFCLW